MLNSTGRSHRGFSARIRNGRALACAMKPLFEVLEARRLFSGLPGNGNGGDLTAITSFGSVVTNGPALQGPEPFPFAGGQVKNELVQPDGKRLVAGYFNGNIAAARYNVDGSLDGTFGGGDGKSVNDLGTSGDRALNMNLRPDGKIVLLGVTAGSGDAWQFAAVRLNADGSLDSTFAEHGKLLSGLGRAPTYGGVSVILADGRIHMTGWDGSVSKAMAFDADGKNGFDRLAGGSGAGLRAGSIPVAARAQEGTLNYFAQGESIGPEAPQTTPRHAQANPSVNEGSNYAMSLSKGDGWTIKWDQAVGPTETITGHPSDYAHAYPDGPATHTITATSKSIYLQGNEKFTPATTKQVIEADAITLASGTTLDLNDNDLIVNNGDFSTVQALVFEGYSIGDTNKTGIVSTAGQIAGGSTILALFDNALVGIADWPEGSGQTIGANAIVGKYTYLGDTNMDGEVAAQDYTAVDANIGATGLDLGIAWFYGDTNFDSDVGAQDYTGIDATLGLGAGNPLVASGRYASPVRLGQDVDVNNVAPSVVITPASSSVNEGTTVSLTASVTDPGTNDTQTYLWVVNKNGSFYRSGTGAGFSFVPDDDGSYSVVVIATDKDGGSGTASAIVSATNVDPMLRLGGPSRVTEGPNYTLQLSSTDPGNDSISQWDIDWGDSQTAPPVSGNPSSTGHAYTTGYGLYSISANATDEDGSYSASNTLDIKVLPKAPTALNAIAQSASKADLSWTDNSQLERGFWIELSKDGTHFKRVATVGANVTMYTVERLEATNQYTFRVRAFNDAGASAGSNEPSVTMPEVPSGSLVAQDDSPSKLIDLGFNINFYGIQLNQAWVNNNGNVTLNASLRNFIPATPMSGSTVPILAPFHADVDTRTNGGSGTVDYRPDTVDGHRAFIVEWTNVGYYDLHSDKTNTFSLKVVNRSDVAAGDFDIVFDYSNIAWDTGDASGGVGGFDDLNDNSQGYPARAGYSNGSGIPDTYYELPGSGTDHGLVGLTGTFTYEIRNPSVQVVAHRTGGKLGDVIPDDVKEDGDPTEYLILTNDDFEEGATGRDFDNNTAVIPSGSANDDDDLAQITLKQFNPSGPTVSSGSISIELSDASSVRLFDDQGNALTNLSVDLASPSGYLAGVLNGDKDVWLEGLKQNDDFDFSVVYKDDQGQEVSRDDTHILIAEWKFIGYDGNETDGIANIAKEDLIGDATGDADAAPVQDSEKFKIQIAGVSPSVIGTIRVTSTENPNDYYDDTMVTNAGALESENFGILYFSSNSGDILSSADRAMIKSTLGLNTVHNPVAKATTQGASPQTRAVPLTAPQTMIARLQDEENRHKNAAYYAATGLNNLFPRLSTIARTNVTATFKTAAQLGTATARYTSKSPQAGGTMELQTGADSLTVTHELVHAFNRQNGNYQGRDDVTVQKDEALAYGLERLLRTAKFLGQLEKLTPADGAAAAKQLWTQAWAISGFMGIYTEDVPPAAIVRKQAPADLWDISAKLGVRFSAGVLRPIYENLLAAHGITEPDGSRVVLPALTPGTIPAGDPLE